ncbi:MAG: hypothetical protein M1827_002793 [Pycnora praestabilis]|nr:MAG: hypothetical protein M1827_002793 [Pycnora praestabilis]
MATTPPPRSSLQIPPTPLHGAKHDAYQPYSTRRSTRSSKIRQNRAQTPPPKTAGVKHFAGTSTPPESKKSRQTRAAPDTFSPPSSAQASPKRRLAKTFSVGGRSTLSGAVNDHNTAVAASALNLSPDEPDSAVSLPRSLTTMSAGMLPTPAKTPKKWPAQPAAAVSSTARILFPSYPETFEQAMPSPRKNGRKGRKYNGFSLESFTGVANGNDEDNKIQIFTDSKDKLPELDTSEENPFYVKKDEVDVGAPAFPKISKRRKIEKAGKRHEELEEALKRDDGMVYVFRGKKIFRKFDDEHEIIDNGGKSSPDWDDAEIDAANTSPRLRPFTRSSVKPRLLFPSEQQRRAREVKGDDADEEAITDIEENVLTADSQHLDGNEMTDAEADTEEDVLVTPMRHAFTPASPPATGRATRANTKKVSWDSSPLAPEPEELTPRVLVQGKRANPFDRWQRTKAGAGALASAVDKGKKREGNVIETSAGRMHKKARADAGK